jgi:hypothetical protein
MRSLKGTYHKGRINMNKFISQTRTLSALAFLVACLVLLGNGTALYAQEKLSKVDDPANGSAVMVAGELWDSFMPPNNMVTGPYYSEAAADLVKQIRVGNFDRAWTTPTHMWPGGWNYGAFWNKAFEVTVWDPDATFNPEKIGGVTNPSYYATSGANYAYVAYPNTKRAKTVPGVSDATRNYMKEAAWFDATKRHHVIYEAAWPTTTGIDVKMRVIQYSLNWNNFNDFIIVEFTFKNTGVVDMNADGTAEKTNHVVEGLCVAMHGEYMASYGLGQNGGRGNYFGAQRAMGYWADNDATGSPWAMSLWWPGESAGGAKDMGIFAWGPRYTADVWSGLAWLGAKDASGNDFPTRFGTPAVGVGAERGWYLSAGVGKGFSMGAGEPKDTYIGSMGTYFVDGGKSLDKTKFNLAPNPNLFASGTAGDPTTFVLKAAGTRTQPNGDLKMTGAFGVNPYEPTWTKGFSAAGNFDGDGFQAIGPFKLNVNESVVVTFAEVGGFRMQGVANAMATARWVYQNKLNANYELPASIEYPAVPEMRVDNTLTQSVRVRWDNRAETSAEFAGYKIYKASLAEQVKWLEGGMRGMDEYWRNMTPGATPAALLKPLNPNFTAQAFVAGYYGVPDSWGPYTLKAVIPKASLSTYADASKTGYNYSWEDKVVDVGFQYWYYVAAYTNKALTLTNYTSFDNSATTDFVETSNVNRNGAAGIWGATYPFASLTTWYPKTSDGLKAIGASFTVKSALANASDLVSGKAKVVVKPNPYKKKALFDNATLSYDHKLTFMNLPGKAKITILDVSGQIIDRIDFASTDPNNGSTFWDMFSKDGVEVASGLYIYVVEYDGGKQVGYFSIMR